MNNKFPCSCCGYKTLSQPPTGTYDICPVCFWEDDAVQSENVNYEGGANKVSLNQARINFIEFGASDKDMISKVRKPIDGEIPDER